MQEDATSGREHDLLHQGSVDVASAKSLSFQMVWPLTYEKQEALAKVRGSLLVEATL